VGVPSRGKKPFELSRRYEFNIQACFPILGFCSAEQDARPHGRRDACRYTDELIDVK
jgi:hypothetical protein